MPALITELRAEELVRRSSAPGMAGEELVTEFLAGRSANTLTAYRQDLAAFAAFQGAGSAGTALVALIALSAGEGNRRLLAWRAAMQEAGLAPGTINRRLSAVRSALRFARTIGATAWVPEISGLKAQTYRDTRGPGLDGTRALLVAAASSEHVAKVARDVAIIRLMFDLGLRRAEVLGLDVSDVNRSGRQVWILGKGRTQKEARTLPVPTLEALQRWIALRADLADKDEAALFLNLNHFKPGRRMTGDGLYKLIRALGDAAAVRAHPHGLRHASITAALDTSGGDVRAAQAHARHANPQTTMRYDDSRQDLAGRTAAIVAASLTSAPHPS